MDFDYAITDQAALRERYGAPGSTLKKIVSHIDNGARDFIAHSPFFVLATASAAGADASPRGGPPGFVTVLDDHRLAFGDLSGNRILDSFRNIVDTPAVGMLFMIPGVDETLRVNGRATLTTDPQVLEACAIDGRTPNVAVGVVVEQCYIHCAKAFRRSNLWRPESWPPDESRPSPMKILRDHMELDIEPEAIGAALEEGYTAVMWEPGG